MHLLKPVAGSASQGTRFQTFQALFMLLELEVVIVARMFFWQNVMEEARDTLL